MITLILEKEEVKALINTMINCEHTHICEDCDKKQYCDSVWKKLIEEGK